MGRIQNILLGYVFFLFLDSAVSLFTETLQLLFIEWQDYPKKKTKNNPISMC